jgi:hypothetical protein
MADTPPEEPVPSAPPAPQPSPTITSVPLPPTVDPTLREMQHARRILAQFDIYVDDYLGMVQGNADRRSRVRRVLLHAVDQIFRPLDSQDTPFRKEPVSVKKLLKGDAYWETRKIILGWILDTIAKTLELPPHRRERLQAILDEIPPSQRRTSLKKWHKVLGELRSMSIALPGSRGLFSHLQLALKHHSQGRLRLDKGVHDALADFQWILNSLSERPTRLYELVELPPVVNGADDAAGPGMGGVIFPLRKPESIPYLWRARFPPDIVSDLVSHSNPHGTVNNSDLELAGTIIQQDGYASLVDVRERTVHTCADNTPAVAWQGKGSVTTNSPPAYLLRLQALHQRFHRYHPTFDYIPGPFNVMADDCSRLWHLDDSQLLAYFNSKYPQTQPWQQWIPSPGMLSAVISGLRRKRCEPVSFLVAPAQRPATGNCGSPSAIPCESTRIYKNQLRVSMGSRSYKSSRCDTALGISHPAATPSALARLKTPSVQLRKRWPLWGPRTLA